MFADDDVIDGKYRIVRLIGEGGMGAVYEGRNLRLDRRVAIKVMHASLAEDRDLVVRFEREAQAAARVDSAHIVDVFDLGDLPNGDRFMVMEFLEGESLLARLQDRGALVPVLAARLCEQVLDGLSRVHDAGIIHRDLKPGNIFLIEGERGEPMVKILDFGVCKINGSVVGASKREDQTGIGHLLGTLPYMAPEHFEQGSATIDERGDLYSVGVVLYRCLTDRLPYVAANLFELIQELREARAPRVCEIAPQVDAKLGALVDRAIDWDPQARFSTARQFKEALTGWLAETERIQMLLTDFVTSVPKVRPKKRGAEPASPGGTPLARIMPVAIPIAPPPIIAPPPASAPAEAPPPPAPAIPSTAMSRPPSLPARRPTVPPAAPPPRRPPPSIGSILAAHPVDDLPPMRDPAATLPAPDDLIERLEAARDRPIDDEPNTQRFGPPSTSAPQTERSRLEPPTGRRRKPKEPIAGTARRAEPTGPTTQRSTDDDASIEVQFELDEEALPLARRRKKR